MVHIAFTRRPPFIYDAEYHIGLVPDNDDPSVAAENTALLNAALDAQHPQGDFRFARGNSGPVLAPIGAAAKEFYFAGTIKSSKRIGGGLMGYMSRGYMMTTENYNEGFIGGGVARFTRIDGDDESNGNKAVLRLRGHGFRCENIEFRGRPYESDFTGEGPLTGTKTNACIEIEGRQQPATGGHSIRDCLIGESNYGIYCPPGYYPDNGNGQLTVRTNVATGTLTMNVSDHGIVSTRVITLTWTVSGGGSCKVNVGTVSGTSLPLTGFLYGGTLTTRASDTAGTLTMSDSAHGIVTGQTITLTWTVSGGGSCTVTVGTVSGTSVPFTGGTGNVLPPSTSAITTVRTGGDGDPLPANLSNVVVEFVDDENHGDTGLVDNTYFWGNGSAFRSECQQAIVWNFRDCTMSGFGGAGLISNMVMFDVVRGGNIHSTGLSVLYPRATLFRVQDYSPWTSELSCLDFKWDRFTDTDDFCTLFDYNGPIYTDMSWITWKVRVTGHLAAERTEYDSTRAVRIPDGAASQKLDRTNILFDVFKLPVEDRDELTQFELVNTPWYRPIVV